MTSMSEVTSFKDNLPNFLVKHPKCATTRFVKDTHLPIQNTSPVHRPNAKLPKALTGRKVKHVSCPVQSAPKRLWYECPKCHRFRNFMDDRDQFILYGVTRLWPTPPPAPPTFSSPQVGASNSLDCMEGTYNICRIFHASSAKLHPRNSQRKLSVIVPSTGFLRKSPVRSKMRPKRGSHQVIMPNSNPSCSSNANNTGTGADLTRMVDLLRRYVSPQKRFLMERSVSPSSNITRAVTEKTTVSKTENTTKVLPPAQKSVGASRPQSPKLQRAIVSSLTQSKSMSTTMSHSNFYSRSNAYQTISKTKLESWAKRLRNGAQMKNMDSLISENDKGQVKQKSSNASGRRKKHMRRKSKPVKRASSVAKCTDASQTNSLASPKLDVCETLLDKEATVSKSEKTSPNAGQWSLGGESMMNAIMSSSRTESFKRRQHIRTQKRARNFPARNSSPSGDKQDEITINTKVTTHIEAVKISDEKAAAPKRRSSRRRQMKSCGSVNLLEKNRTPEPNSVSGEDKSSSVVSQTSPHSPKNPNDPVALLEDFRNRMKKCQGKGLIKASHIEVIAYLEGKKSDLKTQATPKTYQQMGLAPLRRSESSENSTQFLNFKCALSDTEIMPKLVLTGNGRRKKKKKKRKSKSTPSSPKRKSDGEIAPKETDDTRDSSKQVKKSASLGKQKSHRHRGHHQNLLMTTASTAISVTTLSTK